MRQEQRPWTCWSEVAVNAQESHFIKWGNSREGEGAKGGGVGCRQARNDSFARKMPLQVANGTRQMPAVQDKSEWQGNISWNTGPFKRFGGENCNRRNRTTEGPIREWFR